MSGLFNSYEEDFRESINDLRAGCAKLRSSIDAQTTHQGDPTRVYHPPPSTGPLSRAQQMQVIQQSLAHAKDLLTSMTYETSDLAGAAEKDAAKTRVASFRALCTKLDSEVAQLRLSCNAADRSDLLQFGGRVAGAGDAFAAEADAEMQTHRLLALQTTEKLQGGTNTLRKTEALLSHTNSEGRNALTTLRTQTEQISHIGDTTHDVDTEISRSRQLISQMQHTAIKHKLYLFGIIVLLFGFICLLFYLRS